jgi:putative oxidoreductase
MKIAVLIVRILFGGLMVFSSLNFFFNFIPQEMPGGAVQKFAQGMDATVYMFPLIKIIELVVGVSLISGFFVPLATVVLFPISLNIFLFHLFLVPEGAAVGIFILFANLFIAYYYRAYYKPLFESGRKVGVEAASGKLKMQEGKA